MLLLALPRMPAREGLKQRAPGISPVSVLVINHVQLHLLIFLTVTILVASFDMDFV